MNEPVTEPSPHPEPRPEPRPEPLREPQREPANRAPPQPDAGLALQRTQKPWLSVIAFCILTVAVGALWVRTLSRPRPPDINPIYAAIGARLSQLEKQAPPPAAGPDLTSRLEALERRTPPDLTSLQRRLAQLEQRPPPAAGGIDLTPRVEALEQQVPTDLAPLQARLSSLEQRPPVDIAPLAARVAVLEQTLGRIDRVARLQSAALALASGRPLGDIPGAPAALARFAKVKPPTEAGLRLAFPAAAAATLNASRPTDDGLPIMERLLARAENLVTIRQGDHVVVGDSAAGVLVRARTALDAGDLTGALAALANLRAGSSAAMAGWVAEATALRDARSALTDMATQP